MEEHRYLGHASPTSFVHVPRLAGRGGDHVGLMDFVVVSVRLLLVVVLPHSVLKDFGPPEVRRVSRTRDLSDSLDSVPLTSREYLCFLYGGPVVTRKFYGISPSPVFLLLRINSDVPLLTTLQPVVWT